MSQQSRKCAKCGTRINSLFWFQSFINPISIPPKITRKFGNRLRKECLFIYNRTVSQVIRLISPYQESNWQHKFLERMKAESNGSDAIDTIFHFLDQTLAHFRPSLFLLCHLRDQLYTILENYNLEL